MKKLLLLLLFIPLVSCDSTETSNSNKFKYPLDDVWIFYKQYFNDSIVYFEKKFLSNKEKDLGWATYVLLNDMKIENGYFKYSSQKKISERISTSDDSFFISAKFKNSLRDSIIFQRGRDGKPIWTRVYSIDFISKDTLVLESQGVDSLGTIIKKDVKVTEYFFRKPMYSSTEARATLINKKTDLDLELITQEEYDSIKNKLSRYITD